MASTELILSIFQAGVLSNFSGEVPVGSLSMDVPHPNTNTNTPTSQKFLLLWARLDPAVYPDSDNNHRDQLANYYMYCPTLLIICVNYMLLMY